MKKITKEQFEQLILSLEPALQDGPISLHNALMKLPVQLPFTIASVLSIATSQQQEPKDFLYHNLLHLFEQNNILDNDLS
jgi:hypothetical protein